MDDAFIYDDGVNKITKAVFSNGNGERFPIANIKSIRDESKPRPILPMILAFIFFSWAVYSDQYTMLSRYFLGGVGVFFVLIFTMLPEKYLLFIRQTHGEALAFASKSAGEFQDIMTALKKAIIMHEKELAEKRERDDQIKL